MTPSLTLSWRNLWRHKRRTWLTIAAMVFSNVLLVFMISLQFGTYDIMIENSISAHSSHLQVAAPGYQDEPRMRSSLPDIAVLAQAIRDNYPELAVAARAEAFVLASSEERSFGLQLLGVDVPNEPKLSTIPGLIKQGRYLSKDAPQQIIVGGVLARNLKVQVGDEVTLLGSGHDGSFAATIVTVRGIFESGVRGIDRSLAQIPLSGFEPLFTMNDHGHRILVNSPDIQDTALYQQRLTQFLADLQNNDHEVLRWDQMNPGLKQAIQTDIASAWIMYAILIILVAFSVLNTQLMSVLERTREFGIMSAIGLRPATLIKLIFMETGVMAALGLLIGAVAGLIVAVYFAFEGFSYPGMEEMAERYNMASKMYPAITPISILLGPVVVFLGCLLAAVYPALRLRTLEPIAAMRAV